MPADTETLVIGASAAGLATAAMLGEAGRPYELLEATDVVGSAWRQHYDRLHLHTPKSASSLPGLPMASDWPRYPAREQVVSYLEQYRAHHGIEPHGLRKLPYGPNAQIRNDRHIPLLDIGTMDHIKKGRIAVHGAVERFTTSGVVFDDGTVLGVDAVVLGTGYRPALEEFLPEWERVCDDDGRPRVSGGPTALPGLYFCGQFVSPSGMLREAGAESRRIAQAVAAT